MSRNDRCEPGPGEINGTITVDIYFLGTTGAP